MATDGQLLVGVVTNGQEVAYWAAKVETVQISVTAPEDLILP